MKYKIDTTMKKIILISAIAMMGAASLTGCSDFLDAENKAQGGQTTDEYFGKDASELRITAYYSIRLLTIPITRTKALMLPTFTNGNRSYIGLTW
jgi:hypothetical protein